MKNCHPPFPDCHRWKWEVFIGQRPQNAPLAFENSPHHNLRKRRYVIISTCLPAAPLSHARPVRNTQYWCIASPTGGSTGAELLADLKCFQMLNNQRRRFFMRWNPPLAYAFGKKQRRDISRCCVCR